MAMNDEETVALIAGGHTFGKTHGAADPDEHVGAEPEGAPIEEQGLGWKNSFGSGKGRDAITSGLEVTWTPTPTQWSNSFFDNLFGYEWELTKSPAGANQWQPKDGAGANTVPDPEDGSLSRPPTMLTTDLALRFDPVYEPISRRFHENPEQFADAFARAWYKLTHRDMGPIQRYLGPLVPQEDADLAGPGARRRPRAGRRRRRRRAQGADPRLGAVGRPSSSPPRGRRPRRSAAATSAAARTGRASASSRSGTGRSTTPTRWRRCCARWRASRSRSTAPGRRKKVSLADLIVLGGCAAVEQAAKNAGHDVEVPFTPGRTDASQEQTDVESFAALEPTADGFRNYRGKGHRLPSEYLLIDRANLLTLSAPEMTVLVGGLRVLGANHQQSTLGVLTSTPGSLTNDFFVNLLDMDTEWTATADDAETFEGRDRTTGEVKWTGSRADLVFGSNSELRAVAEVYASDDAKEKFVRDFVAAWDKVMNLDRFDVA